MLTDQEYTVKLAYAQDPVACQLYNPAQIRAFKALGEKDLVVLLLICGNGTGKTYALGAIWSSIMFGTKNPLFSCSLIQSWPFLKSARLCAPSTLLSDRGPLQKSMTEQFPVDKWSQKRGIGKGYYSEGETTTGWDWDVFSYDQHPRQAGGHNKGLVLFDEPPPYDVFIENVSRTRGRGLIIIGATPLNYAAWIKEELIDPGALMLDGRPVGKVIAVKGEIWDNCKDRHEGGQLTTQEVERQISLWPAEEREARTSGQFMHLAGRIYTRWGDLNELAELPRYHRQAWELGKVNLIQIQDPHDRKPWAIGWFAVFPNSDVVAIAEWPPFSFKDTVTSPVFDPEEYREIILAAEDEIGRKADSRLMDPNFGHAPLMGFGGLSLKSVLAGQCRKCKPPTCLHSLAYMDPPDSIAEGHMLVRRAIGEPEKGLRPKFYALKQECPNICYGMRHYGYRENRPTQAWKGPSEKPELIHKDFADLWRYGELSGLFRYQPPREPLRFKFAPLQTRNRI